MVRIAASLKFHQPFSLRAISALDACDEIFQTDATNSHKMCDIHLNTRTRINKYQAFLHTSGICSWQLDAIQRYNGFNNNKFNTANAHNILNVFRPNQSTTYANGRVRVPFYSFFSKPWFFTHSMVLKISRHHQFFSLASFQTSTLMRESIRCDCSVLVWVYVMRMFQKAHCTNCPNDRQFNAILCVWHTLRNHFKANQNELLCTLHSHCCC